MNTQYLPVFVFSPILVLSFYYGYTPLLVVAAFFIISLIAFLVYYKDKTAAISGAWRTPESTLHMLSLMCGWPGAIIAQQTLRHKTKKKMFRIVFWLTVAMNIGAFVWLHTPEGSRMLRSNIYRLDSFIPKSQEPYSISNLMRRLTKFNAKN